MADGAFLTDFGLAKSVSTGSRLTRTGQALGTPAYMSPEQARGEIAGLAPATDVWGLGCALYETLAGRPPFEGESPGVVVAAILAREPAPIPRLRSDVPPAVERVLRVALAKAARHRYAGAGALRDDLERILRGEAPRARPRRRLSVGLAAAALAASAGAAGLGSAALRSGPSAAPERTAPAAPTATGRLEDELVARARAAAAGNARHAERLLARALEIAPGRHDLRVERGLLLWTLGEGPRAREEWERVPDGVGETSAALLYRGLEAFYRAGVGEARERLEDAARSGGPMAGVARGALLATSFRWAEARKALRGVPGWEAALFRAAAESGDPSGDPAEAVRLFSEALAGGIHAPWVLSDRGNARAKTGDLAGAIADFEEALRIRPEDPMILSNLANARCRAGDPEGGLWAASEAIRRDPDHALAHFNRGLALFKLDRFAEAVESFSAAIRLDPGDTRFHTGRGAARWSLGDATGAEEDWTASLRLRPDDPDALNNRAIIRRARRDLPGAIEDIERALALQPDYAPGHINLGIARQEMGDDEGAVAEFRIFLSLVPDHPSADDARRRLAECESRTAERRR
ncbi:MAG: tetratricopeptide repeat-containing serine/threonine-protein kinase [Planctomycetales bacterium]|nr:tetratricopeptide repeat-containing serine/threonine-protein kinase [Planctomycetales bacterium]